MNHLSCKIKWVQVFDSIMLLKMLSYNILLVYSLRLLVRKFNNAKRSNDYSVIVWKDQSMNDKIKSTVIKYTLIIIII